MQEESMQYFSTANKQRETYSSTAGDFTNSEDLNNSLPKVMEMMNQTGGGLGINPLMQQGNSTGMPSQNQSMPNSNNEMQQASGMVNSNPSNSVRSSENHGTTMPQQQVLMEPCTVSQPMNASLREQHSKGGLYFLNK